MKHEWLGVKAGLLVLETKTAREKEEALQYLEVRKNMGWIQI